MLEVDISSDIDRVFSEVGDFFRDQIPFVTAGALNDTAFDIRRRIVESTWDNAFNVRNKRFPGRIFRVTPKATKGSLEAVVQATLDYPWVADWLERQATGGTKKPAKHTWVAIPAGPISRNSGGSVKSFNKPINLKNSFIKHVGKNKLILQRTGRGDDAKLVVRYLLVKQSNISKTFRFEEDATATGLRVFSGHWGTRLALAIRSSVFT